MTETTTPPNPQVVACPTCGAAPMTRCISMVNFLPRDDPHTSRIEDAARKPLTLADIPAGQGAASLFLIEGHTATAWFKAHDGRLAPVSVGPTYRIEARALWDHLAATLPTVTD